MIAVFLFIARFFYVFASAFQQKSVIGNHYFSIPFTCYLRAACDYASWGLVAYSATSFDGVGSTLAEILFMGTGATLGTFSGMFVHSKVYKKDLTH